MRITILQISMLLCFHEVANASRPDDDRIVNLMDEALIEQKSGNHKSAIKFYKKIYSKSSDVNAKREALLGMLNSFKELKKWQSGIDLLKLENRENPFVGENRVWIAEFYSASGDDNEALKELGYAEKILGSTLQVLRQKVFSLQKLGRHEDAIVTLGIILSENPKDYKAWTDRAQSYFSLKNYDLAYADILKAHELRSFDERISSLYSMIAFYKERYREVRIIGRKCVDYYPENETCYEYLGRAAFAKQDFSKAANYFQSVLKLNTEQHQIRLQFAESLTSIGSFSESDIQYEVLLRKRPENELAMRSWAVSLNQRKKVETLGRTLSVFCDKNPKSVWANVELAKLLYIVGDSATALQKISKLAEENKSETFQFYNAYFLNLSKDYEKSRVLLAKLEDKNFDVDYHIGLTYLSESRWSEAVKSFSRVSNKSAQYFKAQVNVALGYEKDGQIQKSKEILNGLAIPKSYRRSVEMKIISLISGPPRMPASQPQDEISFFMDWNLPKL